jgi:adenylate kinase family enzyme
MKPKKIYILGSSASGKTTLANKISEILKIKTYDLDDIFWYKKYTKKRNIEKRKEKLKQLIKGKKKWILEGIYTDWSEKAIKNADLIIFLDIPKYLLSWRVFKRYIIRKRKGDETLKSCFNLIKYVRGYKKRKDAFGYEAHKKIAKGHKKEAIILKNSKEINKFLESLK